MPATAARSPSPHQARRSSTVGGNYAAVYLAAPTVHRKEIAALLSSDTPRASLDAERSDGEASVALSEGEKGPDLARSEEGGVRCGRVGKVAGGKCVVWVGRRRGRREGDGERRREEDGLVLCRVAKERKRKGCVQGSWVEEQLLAFSLVQTNVSVKYLSKRVEGESIFEARNDGIVNTCN